MNRQLSQASVLSNPPVQSRSLNLRNRRSDRVQRVRSPGGIEAWLIEDHTLPLLSFSFGFKGGAAQDPWGKPGVAALLAGLLLEGAGSMDGDHFRVALDEHAVEMSFSVDRDNLRGMMRSLSREIEPAFGLLALAVGSPRLDPDAIIRETAKVAGRLRAEMTNPDQVALRIFRCEAFPDHPYGAPMMGNLDTLPTIGRDDLARFHHRTFAQDTLRIAAVGAIDAKTLGRQLDRVFGPLKARAELSCIATVMPRGLGRRASETIVGPQTAIRFGRPGLMRGDPDGIAALVAAHCLGGGLFTSRLFREVREKRGLCYSVFAEPVELDHTAFVFGGTSTKNERVGEAVSVIEAEIATLARDGIGEAELAKAKTYLTGSYALRFDTSGKIASHLVDLQLDGHGVARLDARNVLIEAVTGEDAARAARRLLGQGELLVTLVGNPTIA